jgi:hypothetical protein
VSERELIDERVHLIGESSDALRMSEPDLEERSVPNATSCAMGHFRSRARVYARSTQERACSAKPR